MNSWNRAEQTVSIRRNGWYFKLAPHISADSFIHIPDTLDTYLAEGDILKDSKTTTAAICTLPEFGKVFLKRTNNKGFKFTLRYLFRRARSFRAAEAANALIAIGIETPAVPAVGEHRTGLYLHAGYIINEIKEGVRNAHHMLAKTESPQETLNLLIEKNIPLLSIIHNNSIVHGDYKLSNIYLTADNIPGTWDLDGTLILKAPNRKRMFEDIFRFVSSIRQVLDKHHPGYNISDQELCRKTVENYNGPFRFSAEELYSSLRNIR